MAAIHHDDTEAQSCGTCQVSPRCATCGTTGRLTVRSRWRCSTPAWTRPIPISSVGSPPGARLGVMASTLTATGPMWRESLQRERATTRYSRAPPGSRPTRPILPVRVLKAAGCEPGMTATAAVAVAVNAGARVINMSFKWRLCERATTTIGGLLVDPMDECDPEQYDSGDADDSFELALRAASMLGVVAVTSVGNDGNDADDSGPPNQQNGPAVYPDVISVASRSTRMVSGARSAPPTRWWTSPRPAARSCRRCRC